MGNLTFNSDYEVRLATLGELGGDTTKKYDSVYAIDLEILKIIQEGGIGGAQIDDEHVSTTTTYSSSKIMTLLSDAGFSVEIVQALPSTGDAHTIYFVPKTGSTGDVYDEYLYVDNDWELIGSTEVDLSNYYNKTEVDGLLNGKQNVLTAGNNISIDANGVISANLEVATIEEIEKLFEPKAVRFKANAASTVGLASLSTNQTLEYSTNGTTWNTMDTSTTINLASGSSVYVRGQLSRNNSTSNYTQFTMTGSIAASGNMNYIWNKNNPESTTLSYNFCGYHMFENCTALTTPPELPSTTLRDGCYRSMFAGCSSLTTAPELPATKLALWSYDSMFQDCTNLTSAPSELPATTLGQYCCQKMFQNCTSLTTAPELPATTLEDSCYSNMFQNCTSLTSAPKLPATTLRGGCYGSMFYGCTSLTTAPELPATTLTSNCYYEMFRNCTSLNYIKCLATDISNNTYNWVRSVSATGTFVKNSTMSDWTTGVSGIPTGWTVQNA